MAFIHEIDEITEVYGNTEGPRLIMSCEHASNRIPFDHDLSDEE